MPAASKAEPIEREEPRRLPVPGPDQYPNLALALAAFQANLPQVAKGNTARIPGKEGKSGYSYDYADLTDVSAVTLPALGKVGLAWFTALDTHENGSLILRWSLLHGESGEFLSGTVPVGRAGQDWQSLGGAITYARRYCLVAATGVAPGGDDNDGEGAVAGAPAQAQQNGQPRQAPQQAPIAPEVGELPNGLYALSSLKTMDDLKAMWRQARDAGHLNLTVGIPDEQGTIIATPFSAVLTQVAERLKVSDAAAEAAEAEAVAAHEAELAAAEAHLAEARVQDNEAGA